MSTDTNRTLLEMAQDAAIAAARKAAAPVGELVLIAEEMRTLAEHIHASSPATKVGKLHDWANRLEAAAPVGAVPQGEIDSLCAALGDMFAGDTLDRQQASVLDDTRALIRQLQARNDEQAFQLRFLIREREATEAALASQAARMGEMRAMLTVIRETKTWGTRDVPLLAAIDKLRGEAG